MTINKAGLDLIKRFEGCRLKAYRDVVGIWTIGFGHTGTDVYPGQVITQEKADELLMNDLQHFEDGVSDYVTISVNENQFSALVCFVYNIGLGAFKKSHLCRKLNAGDYYGASKEFLRWANAGGVLQEGLLERRKAEKALFNST